MTETDVPMRGLAGDAADERDLPEGVLCSDERSRQNTQDLLRLVGDKWSLVVVSRLLEGSLRFTELQNRIPGISHRVLTQTLRGLQRDGLVVRTPFPEVPPRVEYALTRLGHSLVGPIRGLVRWLEHHQDQIETNRERFDAERSDTAKAKDQRADADKGRDRPRPNPRAFRPQSVRAT